MNTRNDITQLEQNKSSRARRLKLAGTATVLIAIVLLAALLDYLFKGQEGVIHTLASSMVSGLGLQIQNIDLLFFMILLLICISLMLLWVDRYPKSVAIIMATAALFVAIFIEPDGLLFELVVSERGVIDFSTAPIFLFASMLMLWAFFSNDTEMRSNWWLALAVIFFVFAGEESSWLQHYIGYDTPEALRDVNWQGELNLHNIGSSQLINSGFLLAVTFIFLACPEFQRSPEKTNAMLRLFFVVFSVYFTLRVLMPHANELLRHILGYRFALFATVILIFAAPALRQIALFNRLFTSFLHNIHFGPGFRAAAWILFGAYLIYGIRFQSLGDLRWKSETSIMRPNNMDDELLEFFIAVLSVLLAWRQGQRRYD